MHDAATQQLLVVSERGAKCGQRAWHVGTRPPISEPFRVEPYVRVCIGMKIARVVVAGRHSLGMGLCSGPVVDHVHLGIAKLLFRLALSHLLVPATRRGHLVHLVRVFLLWQMRLSRILEFTVV